MRRDRPHALRLWVDMYTSRSEIESSGLTPKRLPSEITDENFTEWIEKSSRKIDANVGVDFPAQANGWKFTAYPDTPDEIVDICNHLVASRVLLASGTVQRASDGTPVWKQFRDMALSDLKGIRRGEIEVYGPTSGLNWIRTCPHPSR